MDNYGNIIVTSILIIIFIFAIKEIIRSRNHCAYCRHADDCIIKKVIRKDVK